MKDFSEEKIDKIYELFHQGVKLTDILEQFPEITRSAFEDQLPYIKIEEKCVKCGGNLYVNYYRLSSGRSEISQTICIDCGHFLYNSTGCDCKHCQAERNQEVEENKNRYYDFSE